MVRIQVPVADNAIKSASRRGKKLLSLTILLLSATVSTSQAVELKSVEQRYSYVLGYNFVQQLSTQTVKTDKDALQAAIDDGLEGKKPQMTTEEMASTVAEAKQIMMKVLQGEMVKKHEEGQKFLAKNKKKKGVVELDSGVQYIVKKAGKGKSPGTDATVTVNYRGTLIDGQEFDSTYARKQPATFKLSGVVPGFREAISKMKSGAKWKVFIPSNMGYGMRGAPPIIGSNETLLFEIELISFKKAKAKK